MEEKRRFGRIPFGASVTLDIAGQIQEAKLLDLSLKGAKVNLAGQDPELNTLCRLCLTLTADLSLNFRARVVHKENGHIGLKFIESDPESFSHLLRLMELNSGDGDQIEREMQHLGG
ncbi:PilZ domain-containing protein [Geoalkalibacter halelectricus]|uniref:PilZ domain-containing protein n=1 Tax=Geoalkalibacter halelectricus TaxID=2847045 RepID=UPI003D2280CB